MSGPRVLLWDLDGTLVYWRTLRIFPGATWLHWRYLAPHLGWWAAVRHGTATYLSMLRSRSECSLAEHFRREMARRTGRAPEEIGRLEDAFFAEGIEPLRDYIRPIEPGRALFEELAATGRYRMVAATNPTMPRAFGVTRLAWAGYDPGAFELVTGTETSSRLKKHPRFFEELLATLGAAPGECLMIGNDRRKDLVARRVGVPVFLLENGFEKSAGANPDLVPDGAGDYAALREYLTRAS